MYDNLKESKLWFFVYEYLYKSLNNKIVDLENLFGF